ncbi:unnamed protein product, partial [Ectocarpus sp. 12 AP-2014]
MAGAGEEERLSSSRRAAPRSASGRVRLRPSGTSREDKRAVLDADSGNGGGGGGKVLDLDDGDLSGGLRDYTAVGLEISIVGRAGGSAALKSSSSSSRSRVVAGGQRRKSFQKEESSATAVD